MKIASIADVKANLSAMSMLPMRSWLSLPATASQPLCFFL